ncbi:NfeD family protein [Sediminitomix flava]|uniref:NfeD-like partner-binding protein n=1 Tax=Sediminitomix flava TaxID=379075 RepID=A0A315YY80_SEDFL|nr:NfeD family protein [Sediminitomix flava]PWJ33666.1 hypothetical protein BC781_11213 [Sediminitomix flava]
MDFLKELFGTSSSFEAIYWAIAVSATGLMGLKSILSFIGLDLDADFELGLDGDEISVSAILTVLMTIGWSGVLGYKLTSYNDLVILITASVAGVASLGASIFIGGRLKKELEHSGNIDLKNAIGKTAKVYLTIPAGKAEKGQIEIELQGRLKIMDAISENLIPSGASVIVYDVNEHSLVVEPIPSVES